MSQKYQALPPSPVKKSPSVIMMLLRFIKYLLFFIVILLWIISFIAIGILLLRNHTILSKKTAITFILIGVAPVMIVLIYIVQRRYAGQAIFKCN